MAADESEAEKKEGAEAAAPSPKKMPLLLVALLLQLVVVAGAGGFMVKALLFTKRPNMSDTHLKERAIASIHEDVDEFKVLPLEEFTLNLSKNHSLKTTIQIEISNEETAKLLKRRMSAVRARVLNVLSVQPVVEASTLQGKLKLKDALRDAINGELQSQGESKGIVREIYFMEFVLI